MPVITALKPQQKRRQRLAVFIDGEFFAGVEREVAAELHLKVGDPVEPDDLARLLDREEEVRAREKCLTWLSAHGRTRRELQDRLRRLDIRPEIAGRVLDRLEQAGLLNDHALAVSLVQDRLRGGEVGRRRLRGELLKRGVARETVEAALEESGAVDGAEAPGMPGAEVPGMLRDEAESCLELAQRKAKAYRNLPRETGRRRLAGFLARRGFGPEDIFRAVDRALPGESDEKEQA
ncbi:MAG: regulatory protein RecX [candidate division FCPU426 bacterium]